MSTQRTTEYYKGFELIGAHFAGKYQARGHHKFANKLSVSDCANVADALQQIRVLVDQELATNSVAITAAVIENHRMVMQEAGMTYRGVRPISRRYRTGHCYSCKRTVDNAYDIECAACGWIVCSNYGKCGCGFST